MLELKNLTYKPEEKVLIRSLNYHFEKHRIYVITGKNGSGKSSLVRLIAGFSRSNGGSVLYKGQCADEWSITERAEKFVACSFQNPILFKGLQVAELLDFALRNGRSEMNKAELLYHVGLDPMEYMDRSIDSTLSGGELKRIEIASVLARSMPLTILDEPEAGIDLWSFNRLTDTVKTLHKEKGLTFIIISHQEKLMSIADTILCMNGGTIEETYEKDEFLAMVQGESHV